METENKETYIPEARKEVKKVEFEEVMKKYREIVFKKLREYLPEQTNDGLLEEFYRMIREYPERKGKYFRPTLLLLSCEMHGGNFNNALLPAVAMQLSEDWILIHDDIEDHSEERRHRPTLHRIYGNELALNAGDGLHIIMWKVVGNAARYLGNEKGWRFFNKMCDILFTTAEGQYLELSWIRHGRVDITEEEYYKMVYRKAGYYTVTGPIQLGAIVAGASESDIKNIEKFGQPFGCAFQIWDDIMNLTVDTEVQGKERGGDILEGKRTLMLIHLLKNCTPIERDYLITLFRKPRNKKTWDDVNYVLELMEKYGSIEYAKEKAREFIENAKAEFEKYSSNLPDSEAKKLIKEAMDFVISRNK